MSGICRLCGRPSRTIFSPAHNQERCFKCASLKPGEARVGEEWEQKSPELSDLVRQLYLQIEPLYLKLKDAVTAELSDPEAKHPYTQQRLFGIRTAMKQFVVLAEKNAIVLANKNGVN